MLTSLENLKDFSGSAEELARLGTQLCGLLGLSHEELTVRLVRDYAQRDILSRPDRQGKEAVYTWRHLVELLAARALLRDGWPLAKIAEHFSLTPLEGLLALIPGQAGSSALDAARRIREQMRGVSERPRSAPPADMMMSSSPPPSWNSEPPSQRLASRASRRAELDLAMAQLAGRGARPRTAQVTRITLDQDIQLLIGTDRLRTLTLEEADALGRAVSASVIDWITGKGGNKP